jgi:NitT/TauT family transport system substrate-binding protein
MIDNEKKRMTVAIVTGSADRHMFQSLAHVGRQQYAMLMFFARKGLRMFTLSREDSFTRLRPRRCDGSGRSWWHPTLFAAFLAVQLGGFIPGVSAAAAERIRIAAPTLTADSAFFIIALQKGYFNEEGLNVEVLTAGGGISTPALVAGDLQFSLSTGAAISAIVKGARLKIAMVTEDRPGTEIWSTKPEIRSLDDLRGKQVAIQSRGDTGEIALRTLLKKRDLPSDYLSFTPVGVGSATLAVFKAGALPAVLLHWTEIEELQRTGVIPGAHRVIDLANQIRMVYNGIATSDKLINDHPELVEKVIRAALKGVAYAHAFPDPSIKLIADYSKLPLQGTSFQFEKVIEAARPSNSIDADLQASEIALRAELLGVQKSDIPANSIVFDFSFVQRQSEKLQVEGWKPEL